MDTSSYKADDVARITRILDERFSDLAGEERERMFGILHSRYCNDFDDIPNITPPTGDATD